MPGTDATAFADWTGRRSEAEDIVTPRLAASFRAIFGDRLAPVSEGEAPLGLHWCLAPAIAGMDELGADGHPALNRDLPPITLPRRMWAGGSLEAHGALRIGDTVRRVTTIGDIRHKQGRSGELWFVSLHHDYLSPRGLAVRERHDIVFREAATPGTVAAAAPGVAAGETATMARDGADANAWRVATSPVLLFRYSAITFNGHRIHYDLPYATGAEGYPGLVVHGPIQATLLLNRAAAALGRAPARFDYRGLAPAFAGAAILVRQVPGDATRFRVEGSDGTVHMEAAVGDPGDG